MESVKRCSKCHQTKPLSDFNRQRLIYWSSWCKRCKADQNKAYKVRRDPEPYRVMPTWGETRWNSKLTREDVILIRGLVEWLSCTEIAKRYGVHRTTISAIKNGRSWYRLR